MKKVMLFLLLSLFVMSVVIPALSNAQDDKQVYEFEGAYVKYKFSNYYLPNGTEWGYGYATMTVLEVNENNNSMEVELSIESYAEGSSEPYTYDQTYWEDIDNPSYSYILPKQKLGNSPLYIGLYTYDLRSSDVTISVEAGTYTCYEYDAEVSEGRQVLYIDKDTGIYIKEISEGDSGGFEMELTDTNIHSTPSQSGGGPLGPGGNNWWIWILILVFIVVVVVIVVLSTRKKQTPVGYGHGYGAYPPQQPPYEYQSGYPPQPPAAYPPYSGTSQYPPPQYGTQGGKPPAPPSTQYSHHPQTPNYSQSPSQSSAESRESMDISDKLEKLKELRDSGILTEEEYQTKKEMLLRKLIEEE